MAVIGLFITCYFEISFAKGPELYGTFCNSKAVEDRTECTRHAMKVYDLELATTVSKSQNNLK